jgi:hypothetical protein
MSTQIKKDPSQINNQDKPQFDETSAIGISFGLTAFSAVLILSKDIHIMIRLVGLFIYILGGLSSGFLYFTYLTHRIPEIMDEWLSKGGFSVKGLGWISWYYIKMMTRQLLTRKGTNVFQIRVIGYLSILLMFYLLWITFFVLILILLIDTGLIKWA